MTNTQQRICEAALEFKRAVDALEAWDGGSQSWHELQARRDRAYVQLMEAAEMLEMAEVKQGSLFRW